MPDTFKFIVRDDKIAGTATTYNLSDGTNFNVVSFRGRGLPNAQWTLNPGGSSQGAEFNALKLEPRKMQLDLVTTDTTESGILTKRELVYEIFKPFNPRWYGSGLNNDPENLLEITRADSSVRRIACQTEGVVDLPSIADDALNGIYTSRFRVNLLAPYPIWFDPTGVQHTDSNSTLVTFNVDVEDITWFCYPIFTLEGPFDDCTFIGTTNRPAISLGAITGSETITIDLRPFKKTIVDQTGAYRYDLTTDYDFGDYSIFPEWYEGDTTDSIQFSFTNPTADTTITMDFEKQYIGV